ncbi:MAG: hypothetical protein LC731_09060 [Acidobacteria bacterium]|nr:hypothetical protein [Acidobacteriota bacterium]
MVESRFSYGRERKRDKSQMATYTPPPYFPQSSLTPPDKNRYRRFKLMVFGAVLLLLLALVGAVLGVVYLFKWLF